MRNFIRYLLVACLAAILLAGGFGLYCHRAMQHVPEFYTQALVRPAAQPAKAAYKFEQNVLELQNGVLNLVFEEPSETKFVVSPNAPVRQIWVSAMGKSYKLQWSSEQSAFVINGETLSQLLDRLARVFLRR